MEYIEDVLDSVLAVLLLAAIVLSACLGNLLAALLGSIGLGYTVAYLRLKWKKTT